MSSFAAQAARTFSKRNSSKKHEMSTHHQSAQQQQVAEIRCEKQNLIQVFRIAFAITIIRVTPKGVCPEEFAKIILQKYRLSTLKFKEIADELQRTISAFRNDFLFQDIKVRKKACPERYEQQITDSQILKIHQKVIILNSNLKVDSRRLSMNEREKLIDTISTCLQFILSKSVVNECHNTMSLNIQKTLSELIKSLDSEISIGYREALKKVCGREIKRNLEMLMKEKTNHETWCRISEIVIQLCSSKVLKNSIGSILLEEALGFIFNVTCSGKAMFSKKPHAADVKKSSQKAIDPKRDSPTRLKHLKILLGINISVTHPFDEKAKLLFSVNETCIVIDIENIKVKSFYDSITKDNVDISEAKLFFESYFSHVYFVFYDLFLNIESNVKQKAQKSQREELESILQLLEKIIVLLPELIHKKWQCHSIGRVMKRLLHPKNSVKNLIASFKNPDQSESKLRLEGMRLFLIWYQILGENAPDDIHLLFVSLVPDLPISANQLNTAGGIPITNLHGMIYGPVHVKDGVDNLSYSSYGSEASSTSAHFDSEIGPVGIYDNTCLFPPQPGEKIVEDYTIFYFENLMDSIVSQVNLPNLRPAESVFGVDLIDGSLSATTGSPYPVYSHHHPQYHHLQIVLNERLTQCQVILIKWVANFTHYVKKIPYESGVNFASASIKSHADPPESGKSISEFRSEQGRTESAGNISAQSSSVTTLSTGTFNEKDSNSSVQTNDDHTYIEYMIVKDTLYATRDNVNFVHEIFHQAFLLPFTHAAAMRQVVECYKDWIQVTLTELPVFMLEPLDSKEDLNQSKQTSSTSITDSADNISQVSLGQDVIPKAWRNDFYLTGNQDHLNVRAGLQNMLQVFITSAANVFLLEIKQDQPQELLDEQVDMCKRVLNIYRFMVMNVKMDQRTWEQLLLVLLQITSLVLKEVPPVKKENNLGGRLAPALFQTLIVTWIKANLNVVVSSSLWDKFLAVLSSLTHWEELIREWAKTMETLTRVLARQVYGLDLNDLPLERLSEQKQKKRRGKMHPPSMSEASTDQLSSFTKSSQLTTESHKNTDVPKSSLITEDTTDYSQASVFYSNSAERRLHRIQMEGSFSFDKDAALQRANDCLPLSSMGMIRSNSDGNLTLKKGQRSSQSSTRESSVAPTSYASQLQGYARVDIVADTYRKDSLKNSERIKRGHSAKVLINSAESKIPRNFSDFLKNGENKGRMIEIIKDEMDKQKHAFLEKLKCNEIMFSVDKVCIRMTEHSTDVVDELSSNQEEADTKLLLHAKHVFNAHPGKAVLIRSPSGDVDINILFLALFPEDADRIYIDYGTGKSRKVLQLSTIDMPDTFKSALVGFHAFSGNDYISSIFRKSKRICWKKIEKSKKFTEMFAQLGNQWRIDVALQGLIEEYVCSLFMKGKRDINEVRYEMFKNIYEKKSRIQDLSLLPPCRDTLNLRSKRCNYVAKVWKSSLQATIEFDVITANGWSEKGKVIWMNEAFPPDVTEILMDTEEDSDLDETLDGESDSDYDSD
ncbi:Ral GTPase-activating protein subunit alpha-1 [Nymphon striatum]|nr:Ral GTPase-activating protein subunit alpha-1 [Nymphon striatum]